MAIPIINRDCQPFKKAHLKLKLPNRNFLHSKWNKLVTFLTGNHTDFVKKC